MLHVEIVQYAESLLKDYEIVDMYCTYLYISWKPHIYIKNMFTLWHFMNKSDIV